MSQAHRIVYPFIYDGISAQPQHVRFANQVQDAQNVYFSPVDGATKRAGTAFDRVVGNLPPGGDYRLHTIRRSESESYIVIYGHNTLRIFEIGGPEAQVTIDPDALAYIQANNAGPDQLRLATVKDVTFIVNTTVPTATTASPDFVIHASWPSFDRMSATTPPVGTYHQVEGQAQAFDEYWRYDPGDESDPNATFATLRTHELTGGAARPDGIYDDGDKNPAGFRIGIQRLPMALSGATWTQATRRLSSPGAFANLTLHSGDQIRITGGTNVAPGWYRILSVVDDDTVELDTSIGAIKKQIDPEDDGDAVGWNSAARTLTKVGLFAGYTHAAGDTIEIQGGTAVVPGTYTIAAKTSDDEIVLADEITGNETDPGDVVVASIRWGNDASDIVTTSIGGVFEVVVDMQTMALATMHDVAMEIQRSLRSAGAGDALVSWTATRRSGTNFSGYFTITAPWRGQGVTFFSPETPIAEVFDWSAPANANRPFNRNRMTITTGTGSPVRQQVRPADRWVRVSPPAMPDSRPDPTSMPVEMRRTSYTGDGETAAEFQVNTIDWNSRVSGSNVSNPMPDLIREGHQISDITLHKNRLMLAGDSLVLFSQAGDLYNFFIEDAGNIVDSDPIEVSVSSTEQVSIIEYVVDYQNTIVIFTRSGQQFELTADGASGGGGGLAPGKVAIDPSTRYDTLENVRPVSMGNMIYFAGARKDEGVLYEYIYDDARVSNMAIDTTRHAPGILPATLRRIAVSKNNDAVLILPGSAGGGGNQVMVYKTFWESNNKRQSAWSRWVYDPSYRIADIGVIGNDVWFLVDDGNQWVIEQAAIERQEAIEDDS